MSERTAASAALACLAALAAGAAAAAEPLDPAAPADQVAINRKLHCSLEDGQPAVYTWRGRAWSRVPGERDRLLFRIEGMNVRQCVGARDPKRGVGYRLVSRELMLYQDPKTGKALREWKNPWSGETVKVVHVSNDPVNQPPSFGRDKAGKPTPSRLLTLGDSYFLSLEIPLFYTNPLGGDYQQHVGGTYHATEIFHFSGSLADLLDRSRPVAYPNIAWVRIAQWLPWMEMGDRAGLMYVSAAGKKLERFSQLSRTLRAEIARNYPAYRKPPSGADRRPNVTSWTYFKQLMERDRAGGR